jgi:aryl-alcohol dehydrogenase-like predicted oxidoreductase
MHYRMLGRTGMMVSELVIGSYACRTPEAYPILDEQISLGLNYVDTASAYDNGNVETNLGNYFRERGNREMVYLSTKLSGYYGVVAQALKEYERGLSEAERRDIRDKSEALIYERGVLTPGYHMNYFDGQEKQVHTTYYRYLALEASGRKGNLKAKVKAHARKLLNQSLERLQVDSIDVLHCPHGIAMPDLMDEAPLREIFEEFKREGLIRAAAVSFHNDVSGNLQKVLEVGFFDVAMFSYNVANHAALEKLVYEAKQAGIGTIAMKVARLFAMENSPEWRASKLNTTVPGTELSVYAKAYLWALQNPNLSCAVSQMESLDEVAENVKVVGRQIDLQKA